MTDPLETRIRQVMKLPDDTFEGMSRVDIAEVLGALGAILSECLAHVPDETATAYLNRILEYRRAWQAHPRVLEQLKTEGRA